MRAVLLTLFAMVFVSSAWAVIFTAMTAAHSGGLSYAFDASSPSVTGGASSCGFSMEMFPVTYTRCARTREYNLGSRRSQLLWRLGPDLPPRQTLRSPRAAGLLTIPKRAKRSTLLLPPRRGVINRFLHVQLACADPCAHVQLRISPSRKYTGRCALPMIARQTSCPSTE